MQPPAGFYKGLRVAANIGALLSCLLPCLPTDVSLGRLAADSPGTNAQSPGAPLCCLALVQVVCAVGAGASDFSGPKKVDGEGSVSLVEAATAAGVYQFILVTSLGTGKIGFPAGGPSPQPAVGQRCGVMPADRPQFTLACM